MIGKAYKHPSEADPQCFSFFILLVTRNIIPFPEGIESIWQKSLFRAHEFTS